MAAKLFERSLKRPPGLAVLLCIGMTACSASDGPKEQVVHMATKETVSQVAGMRVLFAHQSVGRNILSGVSAVAERSGIALPLVETRAPAAGAGIFHFPVGVNGDPLGKIADYESAWASGIEADVALLKLCYIDFTPDTDTTELARRYIAAVDAIQSEHPDVLIAAATAPLSVVQTGPKAWVKKLLGRQPAGYVENAQREEFNDALRRHFPKERLFDIAHTESAASGQQTVFAYGGRTVRAMDPRITYDGGHLNETGELVVGTAFLEFLAAARSR